jgi:Ca-activated chloride channel family protein
MYRIFSILFILTIGSMSLFAQTDRSHIRMGNRLYRSGGIEQAEVEYSKAVTKNDRNPQALYNLACAYMQQNKDSLALTFFDKASNLETSKFRKSKSFHNAGVICQRHQMYREAIKAYEQSLRLNPNDDETRYNLVLCKRLQKNQPQDNKQQQKQQQKQEKKQEKQEQKQEQQPKDQMSKDNAEQLLQAAMQEEKNTQRKLQKAKSQPQNRNIQKNW